MVFFTKLEKIDIFLLDNIFTPIAYWFHDEFGIRPVYMVNVSIFGMLCTVFTISDVTNIIAIMLVCAISIIIGMINPFFYRYKIGQINPRRYMDQYLRISSIIQAFIFCVVNHTCFEFVWWISILCYWYFAAVTERPPTEKRVLVPTTN